MTFADGHERDVDGECWASCPGCLAAQAQTDLHQIAAALDRHAPDIAEVPFALMPPKTRAPRGRQRGLFEE